MTVARRTFLVDLPVEDAWRHLTAVERWPSWTPHLKRVHLFPPGDLTPESRCACLFKNGLQSTVVMRAVSSYRRWRWDGGLLWLTLDNDRAEITWEIRCAGAGAAVLSVLLKRYLRRNLDHTLPRLIAEMRAARR